MGKVQRRHWQDGREHRCGRSGHPELRSSQASDRTLVRQQAQGGRTCHRSTQIIGICQRNQQVPRRVHLRRVRGADSQALSNFRLATSIIDCARLMVIMEIFLSTVKDTCTTASLKHASNLGGWHQLARIETSQ